MEPIGLLALQGDFAMHAQALSRLGAPYRLVRRPAELDGCGGLIIPGGESTTLTRLIDRGGLREPLRDFAARRPVLGTCAGLIMMAARLEGEDQAHGVGPLGLLDCVVRRNGYGRQVDSFSDDVDLTALDGGEAPYLAVFIRAPRLVAIGPLGQVVATHRGEPVGVRQGRLLGLSFHPELTDDPRVHAFFAALCAEASP